MWRPGICVAACCDRKPVPAPTLRPAVTCVVTVAAGFCSIVGATPVEKGKDRGVIAPLSDEVGLEPGVVSTAECGEELGVTHEEGEDAGVPKPEEPENRVRQPGDVEGKCSCVYYVYVCIHHQLQQQQ